MALKQTAPFSSRISHANHGCFHTTPLSAWNLIFLQRYLAKLCKAISCFRLKHLSLYFARFDLSRTFYATAAFFRMTCNNYNNQHFFFFCATICCTFSVTTDSRVNFFVFCFFKSFLSAPFSTQCNHYCYAYSPHSSFFIPHFLIFNFLFAAYLPFTAHLRCTTRRMGVAFSSAACQQQRHQL